MAFVFNCYQSMLDAWRFQHPNVKESSTWKTRDVEVITLKQSKYSEKQTCSTRFCNLAMRLYEILNNSFLLAKHGFINFTARKLQENQTKGVFKTLQQLPTTHSNFVLITDPNYMRAILKHEKNETGAHAIFSGGIPTETAKLILGDNLLSFHDVEHAKFRKAIGAHFLKVEKYSDELCKLCARELDSWDTCEKISDRIPPIVVEAVCGSFMDYQGPFKKITESIENLLHLVVKRDKTSQEQTTYQNSLKLLDQCAKEACEQNSSLLRDIENDKLHSFVKLMFFAGQDTTSALLEFLILTLGQENYSLWQKKLHDLWITSKKSLSDFALESTELDNLFWEGIRLHPPSYEQTRFVQQDFVIDGQHVIRKGSELHLMHLFSQRDCRRWGEEANKFDPSKRLDGKKPIMYPFSTGPASCLGKSYTLLLVKIFLMTLISKYEWKSTSKIERLSGIVSLKIEPCPKFIFKKRTT